MNFFESYFRAAENLEDKDRLAFYDQLLRFYFDGEEGDVKGVVAAVWEGVKPVVSKSRAKAENGKHGGRPKSKPKANRKQTESKPKANRKQTESHMEKDMEKDMEIIGDIKSPCAIEQKMNPRATGTNPRNVTSMVTMIGERCFSDAVTDAVTSWVTYKVEKNQGYKPTGFKALLTEIENNVRTYGDVAVIDAIHKSMTANYTGIVWDWLRKTPTARSGTTKHDGLFDFVTGKGET